MPPLWVLRMRTNWSQKRNPPDLAQYTFGASPYGGLDLSCKDCAVYLELWPEQWRITVDEAMHFVNDHHRRKHMKRKRKRRMPEFSGDGCCADSCFELVGDLIVAAIDFITGW